LGSVTLDRNSRIVRPLTKASDFKTVPACEVVKEVTMVKARLFLSLTAVVVFLVPVGGVNSRAFPLPRPAPAAAPPFKPLTAVRPVYPPAAKAAGIEGAVSLRVTVEKDGSVSNAEVLNGDPQFARL
jgi:hypothetical protein